MDSNSSLNQTNIPENDENDSNHLALLGLLMLIGLSIVSFCTVLSNGLFLLTFFKDPLKCLRTPSAIFIAGLTSANLLTGLIVEPAYVGMIVSAFVDSSNTSKSAEVFMRSIEALSFVTIITSFLIMLALGVVQYLLIKHPRQYNKYVSVKSSLVAVVCIIIYSILFAVLPEMTNIDHGWVYLIDLILHNILLTVVLLILYLVIYSQFRKLTQRHRDADMQENPDAQGASIEPTKSEKQRLQAEKDFMSGTIVFTVVLIATVWPYCISLTVYILRDSWGMFITVVIAQFIVLWKFVLDPFVFAWRLRKYRKSLILVVNGSCKSGQPSAVVSYHRDRPDVSSPHSEQDDNDVEVTIVDGSASMQAQRPDV